MTKNKERLVRAFAREGLDVAITADGTYSVRQTADGAAPLAEVLLPEDFPVEQKAFQQLANFAAAKHPSGKRVVHACATPDIHPGESVPIGAIITTPHDMVIPCAVGTDISCGMRLHTLDVTKAQFLDNKTKFLNLLKGDFLLGTRDLPVSPETMHAIFGNGIHGFTEEVKKNPRGQLAKIDFSELEMEPARIYGSGSYKGNIAEAPHDLLSTERDIIRDGDMGTVGGGNHFVEIQFVEEILDRTKAYEWGVRQGQMTIMVHTGSRSVGMYIGQNWNDKAKNLWPKGHKFPESGIFPLVGEQIVQQYLDAMHAATNYAFVNRMLLAEMVRQRARSVFGANTRMPLVYDLPHNMVFTENNQNVHRKGATPAHENQPVIIPGSMGHPSYLLVGMGEKRFMSSASHGAGRSVNRFNMGRAARNNEDLGLEGVECITLKEERIIEEAPAAYKDIGPVVDIQVKMGMVKPVAKLVPVVTFKM